MTRYRRGEEGGVYPVFLVAFMVVIAMAAVLMHVGKAGDMRTRAQTAADAAALGAAAEIRDRALDYLVQGVIPWAGYSPQTTPEAARRYAKRNDATVTHIDHRGIFANYAVVDVRGDERLQGIFEKFRGGRAEADAIAKVEFPSCTPFPLGDPLAKKPPPITGLLCDGSFVPIGSSPRAWLRLFTIKLVAKAPPKVPFAVGPIGTGGPVTASPGSADLCAQVGFNAGFRERNLLILAVAIALAESSCNPTAQNTNTNGTGDFGLWQINSIHGYPLSCLYNAQCNANAAYRIYSDSGNFLPWCTYEKPACGGVGNGSYREHMDEAAAAVARLGK